MDLHYQNKAIIQMDLPMMRLDIGMNCCATCSQPPGAAHKSIHMEDFCRNSCFLFN